MDAKKLLEGKFVICDWSSGEKTRSMYMTYEPSAKQPVEKVGGLKGLGIFKIYENLLSFLNENQHYLFNRYGEHLDVGTIISDRIIFNKFLDRHTNCSHHSRLDFEEINKPFLFAFANTGGAMEHFVSLEDLDDDEYIMLNYINLALGGFGTVLQGISFENRINVRYHSEE